MDNSIRPLHFNSIQPATGDMAARFKPSAAENDTAAPSNDSVSITASGSDKAPKMIKVRILPQSPAVCQARTIEFPQDKIGDSLSNDRFSVNTRNNPKAIPDLEGNFLYDTGTPQFDQVHVLATATKGMEIMQDYRGSTIGWAFNGKMSITPHKQEGKNAYYSRNERGANFFYFKSPALQKTVQTSEDPDIVVHEMMGHGVLDGIRPQYLGWDSETMGVHEAFADTAAMLYVMKDETNVAQILQQNGGDMKKESLLSRLGEEFGKAIHLEDSNPGNDSQIYLRSMLNKFTYADPDSLPDTNNPDQLSGECHSFSRVLSGANYDVIAALYQKNLAVSGNQAESLTKACDTFGKLLMKSVDLAPISTCKYKDIALGLLKADRMQNGGKNENEIKQAFMDRKIITDGDVSALDAHMQNIPSIRLRKSPSSAEDVQKFIEANGSTLGIPDGLTMSLQEISKGKNGETTISLGFSEEMNIDGQQYGQYDGYCVDVNGGLTLSFDRKGMLVDSTFDSINDDKKADVRKGVMDGIRKGLIMTEQDKGASIFKTETDIYQGMVVDSPNGRKKIVRLPVIS